MFVEEFVAESTVEALDTTVLRRFSRIDYDKGTPIGGEKQLAVSREFRMRPSYLETARGENTKRIITDCMRDAQVLDKYLLDIIP
jgi:hypothetical protein